MIMWSLLSSKFHVAGNMLPASRQHADTNESQREICYMLLSLAQCLRRYAYIQA